MAKFCTNCGNSLEAGQQVCLNCGKIVGEEKTKTKTPGAKSKIAAGLFGIFLGAFGVHNFYLGYTGKAIAQLLLTIFLTFLTCGALSFVSGIWGLIEGILILAGSIDKDADGNVLQD